jgi:hypothetical protein
MYLRERTALSEKLGRMVKKLAKWEKTGYNRP